MTENKDEKARIKSKAMLWAMQTAQIGEDPLAIISRAEIYVDFITGSPPQASNFFVCDHSNIGIHGPQQILNTVQLP